MPANVKSPGIITMAMIGSVGALWISLVGLFALAITHDGAVATQVANSALALVGSSITIFSGLAGVHIYVTRPQSPVTMGSAVQTVSPGVVVPAPTTPESTG